MNNPCQGLPDSRNPGALWFLTGIFYNIIVRQPPDESKDYFRMSGIYSLVSTFIATSLTADQKD